VLHHEEVRRAACSKLATLALVLFLEARAETETHEPSPLSTRFDVGLAGAYVDEMTRSGFGALGEAKLMSNDFGFGVRASYERISDGQLDNIMVSAATISALIVKVEYYVGDRPIRPWLGGGVGAYWVGAHAIRTNGHVRVTSHFRPTRVVGVAPQVGVDFGRLRIGVTYNKMPNTLDALQHTQSYWTIDLTGRVH
jgi:hypothetical protein